MGRIEQTIFWISWCLFFASFFLPATASETGWSTALFCAGIIADLSFDKGWGEIFNTLYFFMFTVCNLVMAAAPVLLFVWKRAAGKRKKWFPVITTTACVYVIQLAYSWHDHLEIGYYAWALSFVLMSFVSLKIYLRR